MTPGLTIHRGDALQFLRTLPAESVHCCVTSPPYWGLRDYGVAGQLGLEPTPEEYVARMVEVFREVRRVLRGDGTCWMNLGSSYFGGGNGSGGSFAKERPGWSVFGDNGPTQSLSPPRVPACGTDGKALQGSLDDGHACPDCGGELTACSPIHLRRISGNAQPSEQVEPQPSQKDHDTSHADCASSSHSASDPCALDSTIVSSSRSALVGIAPEVPVLESQSARPTSGAGVQSSLDSSAYTSGIAQSDHPSAFRTPGRVFVCMACGYSTRAHPAFKPKDMVPIPWMVAMALQADGWWLRQDIIWHKPNPMPESVTDRCTKAHEYVFLLAKSERYFYDAEAVAEPCAPEAWHNSDFRRKRNFDIHPTTGGGERNSRETTRNRRSVWTIPTAPYRGAHFATFPPDLVKPCVLAGCPVGGTVLDPFAGSGTTGRVALELGRHAVLIELNPEYIELIRQRCSMTPGLALA